MKRLLLLIAVVCTSCTAEELIVIPKPQGMTYEEASKPKEVKYSTFTIKWSSNQGGSYVVFNKMQFTDCTLTIKSSETHYENTFEVTLQNGQPFDLQIFHEDKVMRPELYLAIYKEDVLQYEHKSSSNGFMLSSFVNNEGNIEQ